MKLTKDRTFIMAPLNRRRTLALLGGAGAALIGARIAGRDVDAATCVNLAGAQTEGPYWVEENLNRSDIRVDPADGSIRLGELLNLTINVQNVSGGSCTALTGARVDVWHCDAGGTYSDEAANSSTGHKYLRGYQTTDDTGSVQFTTIYPGWYSGRTVHIHVRIRTYSGTTKIGEFVDQIFFDDSLTDTVFTLAPYNTRRARDTRNTNDMVVTGTNNGAVVYAAVTQRAVGYSAVATIGVNLKTAAAAAPSVSAVVNAASFARGIDAGSWVAIFGQNLASATRSLAPTDIVNGTLPTSLGGVTVNIDNQAAFVYYVSPTQVNVLMPADTNRGPVAVTVTNAAGTSAAGSAALLDVAPAFFASSGVAAAVPAGPFKPGDVVELYGTGFGPTSPAVAPGTVFSGSAPVTGMVAVRIGGAPAVVSYAGMVGAGLYQINVTVPSLANGTYPVIAQVGGSSTQSGVTMTVG
ncbi:MAG: hypothetical protein JWP63_1419 [Candidatus Solibacter sp.]|nr:hypothetical protein [Candidatus Solibacter sp.]